MSARRPSTFRVLSRVLGELRRTEPWGRRLSRHAVFHVWDRAVGEAIAQVARPVSISRGRLLVEVRDSAWLQELELRAQELLTELNARLEEPKVREVRFRLGQAGGGQSPGREAGLPGREPSPISAEDEPSIDAALRDLMDAELRGSAERLLRRVRERAGSHQPPEG